MRKLQAVQTSAGAPKIELAWQPKSGAAKHHYKAFTMGVVLFQNLPMPVANTVIITMPMSIAAFILRTSIMAVSNNPATKISSEGLIAAW